jgi:hypothetical protein
VTNYEAVVRLAEGGTPYKAIGARFGITPQRASQIAVQHGVRRTKIGKRQKRAVQDGIRRLAKRLGVTVAYVAKIAQRGSPLSLL